MSMLITSPHNPRVKQVLRLRDRRGRKQQGRFLIDGPRELLRALEAGIVVGEVFFTEAVGNDPEFQAARERAEAAGATLVTVSAAVFAKIGYGDRETGLVAAATTPRYDLDRLELPLEALVLVVERIEKPGNLGAMLRTADAAGCQALLVADPLTEITNPNVIRASLGAVFSVPLGQADSRSVRDWLEQQGFEVLAARVEGAVDYTAAPYRGRVAIVVGSEAEGLSAVWQEPSIKPVSLPMHGSVDSLNVSAAAAVLLYEAQRQRR